MRAKDIHMALKTENPAEELMKKFEIPTQEQLFESIRRVVPQGHVELIRQIRSKGKICEKRQRKVPIDVYASNFGNQEPQESSVLVTTFELPEEFEEVEEREEMQSAESRENELEQLQRDEQEVSDIVCKIESEHVDIASQRGKIHEKLRGSYEVLKKLREELAAEQKRVTDLCRKDNELKNKMLSLTGECAKYKSLLTGIRGRISELNKISIFVYEDGSIEVENGDMVSVSDALVATGLEILYKLPEADELMVKEVKAVARLTGMVKEYERHGRKYEISFGNSNAQKLWEALEKSDFSNCTME